MTTIAIRTPVVAKPATQKAGLSRLQEARLRRRLRAEAPSEPWVDAQIVTREQPGVGGETVAARYFDATIFPPGGRRATAMRWCRVCGRYTPAPHVALVETVQRTGNLAIASALVCDECRLEAEADRHQELHEALPHLRPAGSISFFKMSDLISDRRFAR